MNTSEMVDMLEALVGTESPSSDVGAIGRCADVMAAAGRELLGCDPRRLELDGRPHLCWSGSGPARVLLLGHLDTVWALGTTARWPFSVKDGVATGPGTFDMKAGLVQGIFALAELGSLDGVTLLVTSDEELGAPTSRETICGLAREAAYTLVLEPSENGALKVARKGCTVYTLSITGRAAHAGLAPEAGRNALVELAHKVLEVQRLADGATTVTPSLARSGTAANTVPAAATLVVDVRSPTPAEQERVREAMLALRPTVDGVELEVTVSAGHPPMPRQAAEELFARARAVAARLGLGELDGVEVGGASDGNFAAAAGCPTLDGLGPVGGNAHAEGEHVLVAAMPERAALVAALVDELRGGG